MGACSFIQQATGKTAMEAFRAAREEALYEYGHSGYTGTIAEKYDFVRIYPPVGQDPNEYALSLIRAGDTRICEKRGPAGCIDLGEGKFLFFGMASS